MDITILGFRLGKKTRVSKQWRGGFAANTNGRLRTRGEVADVCEDGLQDAEAAVGVSARMVHCYDQQVLLAGVVAAGQHERVSVSHNGYIPASILVRYLPPYSGSKMPHLKICIGLHRRKYNGQHACRLVSCQCPAAAVGVFQIPISLIRLPILLSQAHLTELTKKQK